MSVMYYDMFRREDLEQSMGITFADLDTRHSGGRLPQHPHAADPRDRHLMNAERFKMMKRTAILINSARGPIVDTMALNEALRSGTIAGAGLDVTDPEPIPMDSPLARRAELRHRPAHRQRERRDAEQDVRDRGGQHHRGATRPADARAAEPGQGGRRQQVG